MSSPRHNDQATENTAESVTKPKSPKLNTDLDDVDKETMERAEDRLPPASTAEEVSIKSLQASDQEILRSDDNRSEMVISGNSAPENTGSAIHGKLLDLVQMPEQTSLNPPPHTEKSTDSARVSTKEVRSKDSFQDISAPPKPPPKDNQVLMPALHTQLPVRSLSQRSNSYKNQFERSPTRSDAGFDEKPVVDDDDRENDSRSEIQSIMDQFSEQGGGPGEEEVMSPRLEITNPMLGTTMQHPPRRSSLEPLRPGLPKLLQEPQDPRSTYTASNQSTDNLSEKGPAVPSKAGSVRSFGPSRSAADRQSIIDIPISPSLHRPPPPEPEPEPDLPFDFHRFLEQLRHRTADPVAKFLRSFLLEFGKKQWMVHEQVKIISDFLSFISNKMAQCDVWREVSDAEFDNAREGMEKLVMNRLYTQTFSSAIPVPQPIPGSRSRRKGAEKLMGPGRRGQHQEDVERDDILAQKVSIYGWIEEKHLDIPTVKDSGKRFLVLAQQELLKINSYRAPRDKIICVLNCCKVIFGLLKHSNSDSSADSFMPLLIYTVLQANPEHMVSNLQYILRFRNQDKLVGEAGYYLSSLMGAVQFIENLDRTSITISDEEFERNVEAAVSAIAEKHQAEEAKASKSMRSEPLSHATSDLQVDGESSNLRQLTPTPSNGVDSGHSQDEKVAITGLLRTIQKPLSTIGRMFSDEPSPFENGPAKSPVPVSSPRLSPVSVRNQDVPIASPQMVRDISPRGRQADENAAAREASVETAEAHRIQRAEHANVVETLAGMFPDLDRELISDVVAQKDGRVGLAVDACLALSA